MSIICSEIIKRVRMYSIPNHTSRFNVLLFLQELFYAIAFIGRLRKIIYIRRVTIDKNNSLVQQGEETYIYIYIYILQWFTKQIVSWSSNK